MDSRRVQFTFVLAFMGGLTPVSLFAQGGLGPGTFQDLDFGSATVVFLGGSSIQIETAPALPGWAVCIGGASQPSILFNDVTLAGSCVALLGPATATLGANYGVDLLGAGTGPSGTSAIQQTGIIPAVANSIQFNSSTYPFYPPSDISFGLSMNGHQINLLPLTSANNIWSYGGNISQYPGTSVAMTIYSSVVDLTIDDIVFSPQSIPEPSIAALLGLGGLSLLPSLRARRK